MAMWLDYKPTRYEGKGFTTCFQKAIKQLLKNNSLSLSLKSVGLIIVQLFSPHFHTDCWGYRFDKDFLLHTDY